MENHFSCEELSDLISSYYDNELNEQDKENVEKHIKNCHSCRSKLCDFKKITNLLNDSAQNICYKEGEIANSVIDIINDTQTLSCEEVLNELSAFYDNELELKLYCQIERHLQDCETCKSKLLEYKNLSSLLMASSVNKSNEIEEKKLQKHIKPNIDKIKICNYVDENLSAYIDRELSKEEIIKISEHLMQCRACRRDYENLKATNEAVSDYFKHNVDFEDYKVKEHYSDILLEVEKSTRKNYLFGSIASVMILSVLTWFSVNMFEPYIIDEAFNKEDSINQDDALYVNAENYIMVKSFSVPNKDLIAVIYEED